MNQRADELRQKGLRLTPQRELVLQAVRELGHATPEEVAESVRKSGALGLSAFYLAALSLIPEAVDTR